MIKSLALIVLEIDYGRLEEIPDDSQYTIEKRPDFLKKVKADKSEDDYILQMEVQTSDPQTMVRRMLLYYGFLHHDYGLSVKQYVLYIGEKGEATMPSSLKLENIDFKFYLINISDLDHYNFLYSDRPEDVVVAILCDFKNKPAEVIIETILQRLKLLSKNDLDLGRYIRQLEVLSKLRNLQELTVKKIEAMPLVYDLETDVRYQQGYEKAQIVMVKNLLRLKVISKEYIAEVADVSLDVINKIEAQIKAENITKLET